MTPTEKAKQLIANMQGPCCGCLTDAKHAAEECVDEIINVIGASGTAFYSSGTPKHRIKYWYQVKESIKNIITNE